MWPSKEQDTKARAAAKRAREIIAVTGKVGRVNIKQKRADSTALKSGAGAMSVYGGEEKTEPETCHFFKVLLKFQYYYHLGGLWYSFV